MSRILLTATRELLDQTSRETWPALAKSLNTTYSWLVQVDEDKIREPGVCKIEGLFLALGGNFADLANVE